MLTYAYVCCSREEEALKRTLKAQLKEVEEKVANIFNLMPYALCLMPYAVCLMPYALCRMPYAVGLMLYASYASYASYTLCRMPGAGSEHVQGHQQGPQRRSSPQVLACHRPLP